MKKFFCVVVSVLMLFMMQSPAMAYEAVNFEQPINVTTNSSISIAEDLMGIAFDRTSITTENVQLAGCEYTEMTDQNDVKITIDQNGELVRFNAIYAKNQE